MTENAQGITLTIQPKQEAAINSPAAETLYGGAAGGGKSWLLRAAGILWCLQVPNLQVYLFRRTWPELEYNHLQGSGSFRDMLAPIVEDGHAKIVGKQVRFANGSRINLCHLSNPNALTKYQGAEIHVLLLDEATHFTEAEYRYLRARMRIGTLDVPKHVTTKFPRSILGTNPGGVGHHWAKAGFVDQGEYIVKTAAKEDGGMTRVFVPAKLEDNFAMTSNDPDYEQRLEGLGDRDLIRALRLGDWEVIAGAMYGGVWNRSRHVCREFDIPIDWDVWVGADDGYAAPAAMYWVTQNPTTKTYYVIAELYKEGMLPREYAERALAINERLGRCDHEGEPVRHVEPITGNMDSGAFANIGSADASGKEAIPRGKQLQALGLKIKPVEKWAGSRVHRAQLLHLLLSPNSLDPEGGAGLVFFENCVHAIRTIPALGRSGTNPEDVDTTHEDHAYDALTYALQWKKRRSGKLRIGGL